MAIARVKFRSPLPVSGKRFAALESWAVDKHGDEITCEERGEWIVVTAKTKNPRPIHVPRTSVDYIQYESESDDE